MCLSDIAFNLKLKINERTIYFKNQINVIPVSCDFPDSEKVLVSEGAEVSVDDTEFAIAAIFFWNLKILRENFLLDVLFP